MNVHTAQTATLLFCLKAKQTRIEELEHEVIQIRSDLARKRPLPTTGTEQSAALNVNDDDCFHCTFSGASQTELEDVEPLHKDPMATPQSFTNAMICGIEAVCGVAPPTSTERSSPLGLFEWTRRVLMELSNRNTNRGWEMRDASD